MLKELLYGRRLLSTLRFDYLRKDIFVTKEEQNPRITNQVIKYLKWISVALDNAANSRVYSIYLVIRISYDLYSSNFRPSLKVCDRFNFNRTSNSHLHNLAMLSANYACLLRL